MRDPAHARQIAFESLTDGDLERWQGLADAAAEPNPFFEPSFVLPAARRLGEDGVSLLVVEDDQRWRGCMPVRSGRVAHLVPALRAWCHLYCFLGTPLLDADAAAPAATALLALGLERAPAGGLVLEHVGEGGPAAAAIGHARDQLGLVTVAQSGHERAFLQRRPEDDYLAGMRSHRRRELNRLGRRLEAELGSELSVTDESERADAPEQFLELERSGWKGRSATALASSEAHAGLFRDVCRGFAARGRLELLALRAGERTVAMKCNLYAGEGGFCFKIAYDEELARFSPGVQLERENVRLFHAGRDERWQDSCADPENEMINRLWPDRRRISTTVLARRGVRAAVSRQGIRATQTVKAIERRRSSARS